jgi:DNA-binding response OmpR family regulator
MDTVLVVDDEPTIRDVVVRYLRRDGYQTLEAADGDRARELIETTEPSLVVLDVMLPGTDGLALCRWIRARSSLPVILLTARGDEIDRIVGLELGADDYVTKPFSPRELAVRVRNVLRRIGPQAPPDERLVAGELVIDAATREVTNAGRPVQLTAKEFDLLRVLVREQGKVVSREQLMREIWETAWFGSTKTLDMHISVLRRKLGDDATQPRYIATVRGVGFRFERPED